MLELIVTMAIGSMLLVATGTLVVRGLAWFRMHSARGDARRALTRAAARLTRALPPAGLAPCSLAYADPARQALCFATLDADELQEDAGGVRFYRWRWLAYRTVDDALVLRRLALPAPGDAPPPLGAPDLLASMTAPAAPDLLLQGCTAFQLLDAAGSVSSSPLPSGLLRIRLRQAGAPELELDTHLLLAPL